VSPRLLALTLCLPALFGAGRDLESANAKVEKFYNDQWKPGEVVVFSPAEINAWVKDEVPKTVPEGIRDPKVELSPDAASASALVDFLKMEHARGKATGWALSKMIEGERPLKVSVRITSSGGKCTVYLTRVEISGVVVEGTLLDFLVKTFFMPLFPGAKIGEPVDLDFNVDRVEIRPDGLRITMKK
jgi:hypothetical protein